jgi:hypothetical protein
MLANLIYPQYMLGGGTATAPSRGGSERVIRAYFSLFEPSICENLTRSGYKPDAMQDKIRPSLYD